MTIFFLLQVLESSDSDEPILRSEVGCGGENGSKERKKLKGVRENVFTVDIDMTRGDKVDAAAGGGVFCVFLEKERLFWRKL